MVPFQLITLNQQVSQMRPSLYPDIIAASFVNNLSGKILTCAEQNTFLRLAAPSDSLTDSINLSHFPLSSPLFMTKHTTCCTEVICREQSASAGNTLKIHATVIIAISLFLF